MSYCLDDGCELLYGPASADEPATAIQASAEKMGQTSASGKSMVDKTVILSEPNTSLPKQVNTEAWLWCWLRSFSLR
jgi:hypothetical protein